MKLRTDYTRTEHVLFESVPWAASPEPGVERKMLERDGAEVARATSFVRYAPASSFAAHVHERGEEFFVLEGTFEDENGKYPAGTYVRNPPGSRHAPFSREGCVIFVKLRQFAKDDGVQRVVRPEDGALTTHGQVALKRLHEHGSERVDLVEVLPGATFVLEPPERGTEILVVRGSVDVDGVPCPALSWMRLPGALGRVRSDSGASFLMKRGHLSS